MQYFCNGSQDVVRVKHDMEREYTLKGLGNIVDFNARCTIKDNLKV